MVASVTYSPKQATPGSASSSVWSAIRPSGMALNWAADYYSSADATLRGGDPRYTVGVVHLVRTIYPTQVVAEDRKSLISCHDGAGTGYKISAQVPSASLPSRFAAKVGTQETFSRGNITNIGAFETTNAGFLQMSTIVVSDDAYTPDGFYLNSTSQASVSWASAPAGQNLYLGRGTLAENVYDYSEDLFVGWFFHYDAMSERDLWMLFQSILLAKKIPELPEYGDPPDHIFDVSTSMTVGTNTAPAAWTSVGATGGKVMNKTGLIDVVQVAPTFGTRG